MPSVRARPPLPRTPSSCRAATTGMAITARRLHEVFRAVHAAGRRHRLDEAFLDVAGAGGCSATGEPIAADIRRPHRRRARACSARSAWPPASSSPSWRRRRPSRGRDVRAGPSPGWGVMVVAPGEELAFLHPLPVGALWGVGPATLTRLERFGVADRGRPGGAAPSTARRRPRARPRAATCTTWRGPATTARSSPSRGPSPSATRRRTPRTTTSPKPCAGRAVRLADAVAARLREPAWPGGRSRSRSASGLPDDHPVAHGPRAGRHRHRVGRPWRRTCSTGSTPRPESGSSGVSVSNLVDEPARQLALDAALDVGTPATRAVDEVRRRFGDAAVGPASWSRRRPGGRSGGATSSGARGWTTGSGGEALTALLLWVRCAKNGSVAARST